MSERLYQAILASLQSYRADEEYIAGRVPHETRAAAWKAFRTATKLLTSDEERDVMAFRRCLMANIPRG